MDILEQYIKLFENSNYRYTVDIGELLSLLKELRESRELIKKQAQYIENYIDNRR